MYRLSGRAGGDEVALGVIQFAADLSEEAKRVVRLGKICPQSQPLLEGEGPLTDRFCIIEASLLPSDEAERCERARDGSRVAVLTAFFRGHLI